MRKILLLLFSFLSLIMFAQNNAGLKGIVLDEQNIPLPGATVTLNVEKHGTVTDENGEFILANIPVGWYILEVSFLGFEKFNKNIHLLNYQQLQIRLHSSVHELQEVNISEFTKERQREVTTSYTFVDQSFLTKNESGSLMQTLSKLPGISSMDIGSGNSKPVIRGLGFNRVVVAENGLKHEGQEWGHDHGLEIDQHSVERIEIIKGPASLMYGSNAIVGVIDLRQLAVPVRNSKGGNVEVRSATNNKLYGFSTNLFQRNENWYWKARLSGKSYSDYRVPADSIEYMSYYFRLHNQQLRNTAGFEASASTTVGYQGTNSASHLTLSNVFMKSGFFANAHGLEIRSSLIPYDQSDRDIDIPSQQVNHIKIMSNSYRTTKHAEYRLDFGYQHNLRKEFSEPVPHGYMPLPPDTLERQFSKHAASLHASTSIHSLEHHELKTGLSAEFQKNIRSGWGFIMPDYSSMSAGLYIVDKIEISNHWLISTGLRYDVGSISTADYKDWYSTPVNEVPVRLERAWRLNRNYHSISWAIGTTFLNGPLQLKMNAGKSFRIPNAKELSSNGLNYHMFRYEKGDSTLNAEESYQLDLGLDLIKPRWEVHLSTFINYFPNYIYLNPTAQYYEAQQIFYHRQSQVFRSGGELSASVKMTNELSWNMDIEYIWSVQLSGEKKGYTLPFTPPFSATSGFSFEQNLKGWLHHFYTGIDLQLTADQNRIVPPEKKTPGYQLVNLRVGGTIRLENLHVELSLQVKNLFNVKYYDHTSFYRLIEVPGPGRNLFISLNFPL